MFRILFVDDEARVLDGLRRMLHSQRHAWTMHFALGGSEALEVLAEHPVDVILTDMRMPVMDGAALLAEVARRFPATIRMVLSGQTDEAAALRAMPVAHQFLMKPCDLETLRVVISQAIRLRDLLAEPVLREVAGEIDVLPPVPSTYFALGSALGNSASSISEIAAIIGRDPALTSKLLQVVNSSFFGQRREVSSVAQACTLLGTGLIRNIVMAQELFAGGVWGQCPTALVEEECQHALAVAGIARVMQYGGPMPDVAVAAGLLHDVGKLVLLSRQFEGTMGDRQQVLTEGRPGYEVERARLGVSHAEIGAYLLGLWGLPLEVVEAVAYHHAPGLMTPGCSPVTAAVHVAEALVPLARGDLAVPMDAACVELIGGAAELERLLPLAEGALA